MRPHFYSTMKSTFISRLAFHIKNTISSPNRVMYVKLFSTVGHYINLAFHNYVQYNERNVESESGRVLQFTNSRTSKVTCQMQQQHGERNIDVI